MAMDDIGFANQHCAFDDVFEFAYIARLMIASQHVDSRRRDAFDTLTVFARILFQKVVCQKQDVRLPLA